MKKVFVAALLLIFSAGSTALAGTGAHGDDLTKGRYLLALDEAIQLLKSAPAPKFFKKSDIDLMIKKLTTPDPSVDPKKCYKQKLCWYNTDPNNPQDWLHPELDGQKIEAFLSTTEDISSAINVDILRSHKFGVSQKEAIIALIHESGHVVHVTGDLTLADSLTIDDRVIKLMDQNPTIMMFDAPIRVPEACEAMIYRYMAAYLPHDKDNNQFVSEMGKDAKEPNSVVDIIVTLDGGDENYAIKGGRVRVEYQMDYCRVKSVHVDPGHFDGG